MASALQVMGRDDFWALLKGNEDRADVARAMAADDYAMELLGGDELLAYEFLAEAEGREAGTWQPCDALGVDIAVWRVPAAEVRQGFFFGGSARYHSLLAPTAGTGPSLTLLGMARLLAQTVGLMRHQYGMVGR